MARSLHLLLPAFLLAACGGGSDGSAAPSESDIIGGQTDTGDPAVVELLATDSDGVNTCTASFISPTVLLTAAHCVVDDNDPKKIAPNTKFRLNLTPNEKDTDHNAVDIALDGIHPHPDYDGDQTHDVALLVLRDPQPIAPLPILRTPFTAAMVNRPARLVGYGQSRRKSGNNDGSGVKRTVNTKIRELQGDLVKIGKTGQQACDGDSGGPALARIDGVETIVATDDVSPTDKDCTDGDLYQRVDVHLGFIDPFLNK
jgi:secreted trypsin-like serine protease